MRHLSDSMRARIRQCLMGVWAICWKDVKLYYLKGPVVVTGVLFPLFLWFAFYAGKGLELGEGLASLTVLTLFFTASSITPIIAPWETRQRTFEMLLSRPITVEMVLIGDILASTLFGILFAVPLITISIILGVLSSSAMPILLLVLLIAWSFSSLGAIFSALPTDVPADVVMISSAVRLPLIFISGIFIPITQLPSWMLPIAFLSPLTYPTDLLKAAYNGGNLLPWHVDLTVTLAFTLVFTLMALKLHRKSMYIRLQR